jgi:hypothetical protein
VIIVFVAIIWIIYSFCVLFRCGGGGATYVGANLVGGGGQHGKFDALDYRKIKHGDAGKLGKYDILSVLPDKFARFLYELHDFLFSSLDLPPLPSDRSQFDVHGAIDNDQV